MTVVISKNGTEHVGVVAVLIGTMSFALVLGLGQMGLLHPLDVAMASLWSGLGDTVRPCPRWVQYVFLVWMAYVIPALMLLSPALWRKCLIWWGMMLLYALWIPVLVLASWIMPASGALIAGLWSGFCALFFAMRHRLPCEVDMINRKKGT